MNRAGSADSGTSPDQGERGGANPTSALPKAWQRLVRERLAECSGGSDLFGQWWTGLDLTLGRSIVRPIGQATAAPFIREYEYLGTMPAVVYACYGLFFDGAMGGVAVYSPDYAENLGVWDRYGYTGRMWVLTRGACAHWTPVGSASRLIRQSMRLLPSHVEVVSATVDAAAGEIGTVYQAAGWDYVGLMCQGGRNEGTRSGVKVSSRQIRRTPLADRAGMDIRSVARKARYFAFRGPNAPALRSAIAPLLKKYPKRAGQRDRKPASELQAEPGKGS